MRTLYIRLEGEIVASINVDETLIQDWNEEDYQILSKAIVWEITVHSLIGKSEIWCNPWIERNQKVKNLMGHRSYEKLS